MSEREEKAERGREEGGAHGGNPGGPEVDTLRWALGNVRSCACSECWAQREIWRQVRILLHALDEVRPDAPPGEIARFLWEALSRSARFPIGASERYRARAARWLQAHAESEGWNIGQLYEVVVRGVARHR